MVQIITDSSILYTMEEAKALGFESTPLCVSIGDFEGRDCHLDMTDGLSGTYQSACGVREMMDHNENIHVFNSTTLCGPHRYMVEKAQKMKEAGHTAAEILDWLNYAATTHESFLIPQDFAFLRRGCLIIKIPKTYSTLYRKLRHNKVMKVVFLYKVLYVFYSIRLWDILFFITRNPHYTRIT